MQKIGRPNDRLEKKAWDEIANNFNSHEEVSNRDSQQLKKCWENIKSRAKKDVADEKRERRRTGGGECPAFGRPGFTSQVLGIIPSQLKPLHNPYDEDASYHHEPEAACLEEGEFNVSKIFDIQITATTFLNTLVFVEIVRELLQSPAAATSVPSAAASTTPSFSAKKRKMYDVAQNTDMLAREHEMQMMVWRSQLEKDRLWKEEHELRMCILRKQYELLCKTGIAAPSSFNDSL